MLIECPECRAAVSDQAPACPHCGNPLTVAARHPVGARKTYQQWARGFGFLFLLGLGWAIFREPGQTPAPGSLLMMIGFPGWLAFKWRAWFYS